MKTNYKPPYTRKYNRNININQNIYIFLAMRLINMHENATNPLMFKINDNFFKTD